MCDDCCARRHFALRGRKTGTKIKGWGIVTDPDGDCEVTSKESTVSFNIPTKPHDYAVELNLQNSPRVMTDVKGDFIAEVLVTGTFKAGDTSTLDPAGGRRLPYHGAGLLLVKDESTYITMARACLSRDGVLDPYANFEMRDAGQVPVSRYQIKLPEADRIWLRLERRANHIYGSVSEDGTHWKSYESIDAALPETLKIGIVGINSCNVPLEVKFDNFSIFKKTEIE